MGLRDWFRKEKFVLPDEASQRKFIIEIEKKILTVDTSTPKGKSEYTRLIYMLANQISIMDRITSKKKPKKPVKLNNRGKWVWVDDDYEERPEWDWLKRR